MTTIEKEAVGCFDVRIVVDEDPPNPVKEWDNLGTMILLNGWSKAGDSHAWGDPWHDDWGRESPLPARIEQSAGSILFLPLFLRCPSRGGLLAGDPGDWDPNTRPDGICYVTLEDVRKEYSCKRISRRVKDLALGVLRQEVETYDDFLTGSVYGYVIQDPFGETVDSCFGIYGLDYARQEARSQAEWFRAQPEYCDMPDLPGEEAR